MFLRMTLWTCHPELQFFLSVILNRNAVKDPYSNRHDVDNVAAQSWILRRTAPQNDTSTFLLQPLFPPTALCITFSSSPSAHTTHCSNICHHVFTTTSTPDHPYTPLTTDTPPIFTAPSSDFSSPPSQPNNHNILIAK